MAVKYPLGEDRVIKYTGILDVNAIQKILDQFFMERNYDRYDEENRYLTTKNGRLIEIETRYEKQYSDDDYFECKAKMTFADVKPVEVVVDGTKQKLHHGRCTIEFQTFIRVNGTGNWGGTALKTFINFLGTFFIFKHHYDAFRADAKADMKQLYEKLLHYINGSNTV